VLCDCLLAGHGLVASTQSEAASCSLAVLPTMQTRPWFSMCADTALVLDHGSHIFIWLGTAHAGGGGGAGPESPANGWTRDVVEAAAQGFVAGLADGRFPVPEVRVAVEVLLRSTLTQYPHFTVTPRP